MQSKRSWPVFTIPLFLMNWDRESSGWKDDMIRGNEENEKIRRRGDRQGICRGRMGRVVFLTGGLVFNRMRSPAERVR